MTFDTLLTQEKIDTYTASGLWQNKLLTDFLDAAAAATPDKVATVDPQGSMTYREFHALVDRCAFGLLELGIRAGDVVAVQLPNWREWLILHYAAVRIGAVTNPLIPIYRDREVGYMLKKSKAKLLLIAEEFRGFDYTEMVDRLREDLPKLKHVYVISRRDELTEELEPFREGFSGWEEFIQTPWEDGHDASELAALRPDPNSLALIIFTSGTTGRPKGVMHTHNSLIAGSMPWPDKLGMDDSAVVHMASTFGHLTGYLYGVSLPVILGGTGVFQDLWNAEAFFELVERYGIQHTSGATPFLHDLLESRDIEDWDLSSLKHFCCMGAPIPRVMVETALHKLPQMTVFGGWGQTECCLVTMGHPSDPLEKIINSDGRALPGMHIRVIDSVGKEAAPDTEGALQVHGPFLFQGYLGQLDLTREQFDGDWFDTGDIATIDEDGYLRIQGRTKDVIIRGGENIPVAYVENVLYEHPRIDAVALVGIPHPRLQEMAIAVIVLKDPDDSFTLEELRAYFLEKGVAKPYWPERVEVVDALPRTPSGKIQKYQLRARLVETVPVTGTLQQVGVRR
ncbi:AMP-binding protein [Microbacterium aurantiacum]|uniref:AMP-binding protein n=1 Tax=Microbacterium aurantiacum TaxID=162393 RepID=UPI0034195149